MRKGEEKKGNWFAESEEGTARRNRIIFVVSAKDNRI
jgi:hypothetical protein